MEIQRECNEHIYMSDGIYLSIKKWKWAGGHWIYCSYIKIYKKQVSIEDWKKLNLRCTKGMFGYMYNYGKLEDYFNFSGGITFYEKKYNKKGKVNAIQFGNDYNHIWNGGETLESIQKDLEKSLKTLKSKIKIESIKTAK